MTLDSSAAATPWPTSFGRHPTGDCTPTVRRSGHTLLDTLTANERPFMSGPLVVGSSESVLPDR